MQPFFALLGCSRLLSLPDFTLGGWGLRRVLEELSILMRSKRIGVFRERGSGAWKDRISAVVTGQKFRKVTCDSNYSNHQ